MRGVLTFFKDTWRTISSNKLVLIAFIVFIGIVLFAVIGPAVLRDPFEQVKELEIIEKDEQFSSPLTMKVGTIGQIYNISGTVDTDTLNSSNGTFIISGRILTFYVVAGDLELLGGQIEFSLWKGDLSTYVANNDLVETKIIPYDETEEEFVVEFEILATQENVDTPYVLTFEHHGTPEYFSGDFQYTISTEVVWYQESMTLQIHRPPSLSLPLGTDEFGYDAFAQLASATRNSLLVGILAGIIATLIAIILGSVAGYLGGFTDDFSQLIVNIMMVFPVFPLLIIIAGFVESRSLFLVGGIIAAISWPWATRSIRSQILSLKERDFVRLAKITAKPGYKIAITELLPNMMAYIILIFAIQIGGAIAGEAGISMIGFGPDPRKHITLGTMLYWVLYGESIRSGFWWLYLPPGVILTLFFVILYVFQSNLDEIFNPRLRTGAETTKEELIEKAKKKAKKTEEAGKVENNVG